MSTTTIHSLIFASDKDFLSEIMQRMNTTAPTTSSATSSVPAIASSSTSSVRTEGASHSDKQLVFIRLIWLLLSRYGRREALPMLFHLAKTFSPMEATTGVYNESLTYFWINTVHFAMTEAKVSLLATADNEKTLNDFKIFLAGNPHLMDENYVFTFYSRSLLMSEKAKESVVLPDLQPMPCIVRYSGTTPITTMKEGESQDLDTIRERLEASMPRVTTLSDQDFYHLACEKRLPCWGHQVKLRLIYCLLLIHGRQRGGVDEVLQAVKEIEKTGFNVTVTYFWIQLSTYHMMKVLQEIVGFDGSSSSSSVDSDDRSLFGKLFVTSSTATSPSNPEITEGIFERSMSFDEFIRYDMNEELTNAQLIEKYYPKETLLTLHDQFVTLPTIKPLPNIMVN